LNHCVSLRSDQFTIMKQTYSACDTISSISNTNCFVLEAGGAMGFFAFITIGCDAVLHGMKWIRERKASASEPPHSAEIKKAEGKDNEGKEDDDVEQEIENPYAA